MDETVPVVPDGYVHRSVLIDRGWTAAMVNAHAGPPIKVDVPTTLGGISNKAYAVDVVERAEKEVPEIQAGLAKVRTHLAGLAGLMPRGDPAEYTLDTTWSRATLIERGWTPTHIHRLVGDPDLAEPGLLRGVSYRYGRERVTQAETTDPALQRRLGMVRKERDEAKEKRIADTIGDGVGVWRRVDGRWLVQGINLTVGQRVTVATKTGDTEQKQVLHIVESREDGTQLVVVGDVPRPVEVRPVSRPAVRQPDRVPPDGHEVHETARHLYSPDGYTVGQVVNDHGRGWLVVVSVRSFRVDEDVAGSLYGGVMLGREDEWCWDATCRPATDTEAASAQAVADAWRTHHQAITTATTRKKEIARQILETGEWPDPGETGSLFVVSGRRILDTQDPYGGGDWFVVADDGYLWYVRNNGMDGDNWAHNNVGTAGAGAIGCRVPLDEALVAELDGISVVLASRAPLFPPVLNLRDLVQPDLGPPYEPTPGDTSTPVPTLNPTVPASTGITMS